MMTIQRAVVRIPGLLRASKFDDLVHVSVLGFCVYVRAGKRRKLFGIVWGSN